MKSTTKKKFNLTGAILLGLLGGILFGLLMPGHFDWMLPVVQLGSSVYMNALRMMIFPMVFCSLVIGIQGIGSVSSTGKIGGQAVLYFILTTVLASTLGLFLPRALGLGKGVEIQMMNATVEPARFTSLVDTIRNIIPANPLASFVQGDMLQVLVFALIVGMACLALGEEARPVVKFIESLNKICLKIVSWVMYCTPFGVFCSISAVMYANKIDTIFALAGVLAALYFTYFLYTLIVYGGIARFVGKVPVKEFFRASLPAGLNAFGTCSSAASIPLSKTSADKMGVPNEISSLSIPLGATINMDAVSILMSFMLVFFANACGIELSFSTMLVLMLSNALLSIGAPGVPGSAIACFAALSTIAGLPAGIMGVYISINTLCDMGATCTNILGDIACTVGMKETCKLDNKNTVDFSCEEEALSSVAN